MEVGGRPLVDFPIVEPLPCLSMGLCGAWLEEEHMSSVLQCRHALAQRLPVVGDDDDPALGREFPRNALPLGLAGFDEIQSRLAAYLGSISAYRKNRHADLPDSLTQRIAREWGRNFDEWGYRR
jgi:hypothetical protein